MARSLPARRDAPGIVALLVLMAAGAQAQQPASPRMLVPPEIRPGEVARDPGITVPERIIPAPPGHGAEVPLPPARSDETGLPRATPDRAVLPPGGGDPGILAPSRPEGGKAPD